MTLYFDKIDEEIVSNSSPAGKVEVPIHGGFYRNYLKQVFDTLIILVLAPIVLPLVLLFAIIIGRDGNNPFYLNRRVGKGGKTFKMLKLRTMVPNADKLLEAHLASDPATRAEWETNQKLKNDPRITSFGKFLRKSSLDELPQLWNVLTGDMSLVGPRPMLPSQREIYPGLAYYALRPGITGSWQVSDRNNVEFSKRAEFDRDYYVKMSFPTDIGLLAKTIGVVFKGTGY